MSTFNIQKDSVKLLGDSKVGMTATFKAFDNRTVTCYHESESVDKDVIEQGLQKTADEFESRPQTAAGVPDLTTDKDMSVVLEEKEIVLV